MVVFFKPILYELKHFSSRDRREGNGFSGTYSKNVPIWQRNECASWTCLRCLAVVWNLQFNILKTKNLTVALGLSSPCWDPFPSSRERRKVGASRGRGSPFKDVVEGHPCHASVGEGLPVRSGTCRPGAIPDALARCSCKMLSPCRPAQATAEAPAPAKAPRPLDAWVLTE